MYFEVVEGDLQHRRQNGKIVHETDLAQSEYKGEKYLSLFQYPESIKQFYDIHQTVAGYNGNYYLKRFWIDIDSKDLEIAKRDAIEVVHRLISYFEVDRDEIYICFSGGKGFHIGLHETLFGGFESSSDLPKKVKKLAEYMLSDIATVDLSIYSANRAFRAINSQHAGSGLFKIGITYEELMGDLDYILILSEQPRQHEFSKQSTTRRANPKLTDAWAYISSIADNEDAYDKESGGALDPEHEGFFTPANEGDRNNKLFKQACMLFDKSELSFSHVFQIMANSNAASPNPLHTKELYTLVRSSEQRTKAGKSVFTGTGRTWFTLGEQAQEIMDSMSKEGGQYSTSFPSFDRVLDGDLKGKMLVIAGQGGTRKSILAQQMLFYNVVENGMRGIYNNQEMSKSQWLQRGVNMLAGGAYVTRQAWQAIKEEYESDRESALKGLNSFLKTDAANRVIVDYRMASSTSYYRKVIEEVEKASGRIDMLVVDGLSMMDDKGGEMDSAAKHTRELKQLANELDIFVVVLVHVTKDVTKHTRDLMRGLRGSGKIYDNGDIFISCSLCVDQEESTDDDLIYRTDIGYLRLFDKRESGKTINVIYNLDPIAMRMRESDIVPSFTEVKVKEQATAWRKF